MLPSGPTALNTAFYREGGVVFILFFFTGAKAGVTLFSFVFCFSAYTHVKLLELGGFPSKQAGRHLKTLKQIGMSTHYDYYYYYWLSGDSRTCSKSS